MMPTPELRGSHRADLRPSDLVLTGSVTANGPRRGRLVAQRNLTKGKIGGLATERDRCVREAGRTRISPRRKVSRS